MNARFRILPLSTLLLVASSCADTITGPPRPPVPTYLTVTLSGHTQMASIGDSLIIAAGVYDAADVRLEGREVAWAVEPANVVENLGNGIFRAVGNGTARIIVSLRDGVPSVSPSNYRWLQVADTVEVQVAQVAVQLIAASVDSSFWSIGASRRIATTLADARGNTLPESMARVNWTSSDPSKVRVDSTGLATAVEDGTATLRAVYGTLEHTLRLGVSARVPIRRCVTFAVRGAPVERCSPTLQLVVTERAGGSL